MGDVVCLSSGDEMELEDIVEVYEEVSICKYLEDILLLLIFHNKSNLVF